MTRLPAAWKPDQPGTVTTGSALTRVTAAGDTRVTSTGDTRVTSGVTITPKEQSAWVAN